MEDYSAIEIEKDQYLEEERENTPAENEGPTAETTLDPSKVVAFFAVFDGHGGPEAASFASRDLWSQIKSQRGFWSKDQEKVCDAIRKGFHMCHLAMWKQIDKWPKIRGNLPSMTGTTASVVIIRGHYMFTANVGNSAVVAGLKTDSDAVLLSALLTKEHKPEAPGEREIIEGAGGRIITRRGVQHVAWERPRSTHRGLIRRSTQIYHIPVLALSRSLGDLWSFNYLKKKYAVSPDPDISVTVIDPNRHKYIILGTDGLWDVMSPSNAVNTCHTEDATPGSRDTCFALLLGKMALQQWQESNRYMQNICITVLNIQKQNDSTQAIRQGEFVVHMATGRGIAWFDGSLDSSSQVQQRLSSWQPLAQMTRRLYVHGNPDS